jgi:asparagine synthase (glutamine-hydrolysing)
MCGIVGFIDSACCSGASKLRSIGRSMAMAITHRGPDDSGIWVDETVGIVLAHRRLSILDLSPLARQPMVSKCGRYVLVFNGEIYNYRALRAEMINMGSKFTGLSDTEVLLEAISCWGLCKAVQKYNGMFAFAIWDMIERRLFLVRDRFGEKPLYYGWFGEGFAFGSELKALRPCPGFDGEVCRQALATYFRRDFIPAPSTIYKLVKKVPPSGIIEIDPSIAGFTPKLYSYWSAAVAVERGRATPFDGTEAEAVDELDLLLEDAVRLRMQADVSLGAFLSGGIDSSTVVALMQKQSRAPVQTFTVDFSDHPNEAEHATRIAGYLGTDHHVLKVTSQDALNVIPRLPEIYDEPFADNSQIPTCLISDFVRHHVTVSLSGDGGDELFCGYNRYVWANMFGNLIERLPSTIRDVLSRTFRILSNYGLEHLITAIAGQLPPSIRPKNSAGLLHRAAEMLSSSEFRQLYLALVSRWEEVANLVEGAESEIIPSDICKLNSLVRNMMFLDTISYLPDDILVKLDRASMAVSLEARVPLLDHRVFEFACRVPIQLKLNGKGRKRLLHRVLGRYIPRGLFERPKEGFRAPIRQWLQGPLRPWAESLLSERALRSSTYLNPQPIIGKWNELIAGRGNWEHHIWSVLMFQAWLKLSV